MTLLLLFLIILFIVAMMVLYLVVGIIELAVATIGQILEARKGKE